MKLLIITQAVDKNDQALGFFHRWIEEFAKHCESVIVICLREGKHSLPQNVRVLSLGKEVLRSRLRYVLHFYKYISQERDNYDVVFVHMNSEYILLGGLLWKFLRKKIFLWRNHYSGSWLTSFAARLCQKIFYTSQSSFTARFSNAMQMPVGIDTEMFVQNIHATREKNSILFLGRLDASKRVHLILEALGELKKRNIDFSATVVGNPSDPSSHYPVLLREMAATLDIQSKVMFVSGVAHSDVLHFYQTEAVFVNASKDGMYDKTIFEAMACGMLAVASSKDFANIVPEQFVYIENDASDLARTLENLLAISEGERALLRKTFRAIVEARHSLQKLALILVNELKKT